MDKSLRLIPVQAASFAVLIVLLTALAASASAHVARTSPAGSLSWQDGPVLHSSAPYLVFWTPAGESIPASSRSLMKRFFADAAADSGKSSNVFGVLRQYHDRTGFADYRQNFNPARQAIVDTHAYPTRDTTNCPRVSTAYPTCITDAQLQAELQRLITADRLRTAGGLSGELYANAPVYFVVFPADVNVCTTLLAQGGMAQQVACIDNALCGYHGSFLDISAGFKTVLYSAIPLRPHRNGSLVPDPKGDCQTDGTSMVQEPNHDAADLLITEFSHELSETITDPIVDKSWYDPSTGNESGDNCGATGTFDPAKGTNPNAYLPTLGGSAGTGTLYDQLVNGHPYYIQSEWSNGNGTCEMRPTPGTIAPRFTVPARPATAGSTVRFNPGASTSTHPDSSATWNFGDHSRGAFLYGPATLTPTNHTYATAGRYTVTLTLIDNRGNLKTTTHTVDIK
jgi:hypothetical protein